MNAGQQADAEAYNKATERVAELSEALGRATNEKWRGLAIDLCLARARQAEALSGVLRGLLGPGAFGQAVREAVSQLVAV